MNGKILLFIPAYNCEKQILRVLDQIDDKLLNYIAEIIIVNNRSTDQTEKMVTDWVRNCKKIPTKLLRNNENYGLGGSHKVAFDYALNNKFDFVITLHGDDQGNLHDLLPILQNRIYLKYDCCLGARFMKGSQLKGYSRLRNIGNQVYNSLFTLVCRFKIKDLGSGLNIYKVDIFKNKYYQRFCDNLTFNCCMLMAIQYYKQKALFFPISWREDDQVSNVKLFSQARQILYMLGDYCIHHKQFMEKELREKPILNYSAEIVETNIEKAI